jgi:acyl-[acyl carrier protein]--UDP-N-acetylglucosamine O-acyltransferase
MVFQSDLNVSQGVVRAAEEVGNVPEVTHFLDFIRNSERGITF